MSPLQLSFRAAQRAVAPPSSRGGTAPLCRPTPPALGTALDPVHIVVGELSPPTADVTLYLDPLAFQYVFIHPFLLFVIKLTKICTWGANGSSWVRRISGPAVGTTSIGHRAFFIRRI